MENKKPVQPKKSGAKKSEPMNRAMKAADEFVTDSSFDTDPLGSYTGYSEGEGFYPSQDADDL